MGMNTIVVASRTAIAQVDPKAQNAVNAVYMVRSPSAASSPARRPGTGSTRRAAGSTAARSTSPSSARPCCSYSCAGRTSKAGSDGAGAGTWRKTDVSEGAPAAAPAVAAAAPEDQQELRRFRLWCQRGRPRKETWPRPRKGWKQRRITSKRPPRSIPRQKSRGNPARLNISEPDLKMRPTPRCFCLESID